MVADRIWSEQTIRLIQAACEEDLGQLSDITSMLLDEPQVVVEARVVSRADGVLCGLALGPEICAIFTHRLKQELKFDAAKRGTLKTGSRSRRARVSRCCAARKPRCSRSNVRCSIFWAA